MVKAEILTPQYGQVAWSVLVEAQDRPSSGRYTHWYDSVRTKPLNWPSDPVDTTTVVPTPRAGVLVTRADKETQSPWVGAEKRIGLGCEDNLCI